MQLQRDEKGRFVRGNTISVGNKGNTYPKWGNKNAKKHGFFSCLFEPVLSRDKEILTIAISMNSFVSFSPGEWERLKNGEISIYGPKAEFLESIGMPLLDEPPRT
ncbi:hypothetical protein [Ureibacillus endophyticus]|uniref:Uncharacterized protein n=1 Tax=Ureibacillus endophyticus TaxID=1978490 RepID=A0A494YTJ7_9BACL|nr:hypothetical protein [Lysinibacillus endophyticus]RKQ13449.1 hypothetical protein D8M03_16070 [Lysinibacillus endophyticus]